MVHCAVIVVMSGIALFHILGVTKKTAVLRLCSNHHQVHSCSVLNIPKVKQTHKRKLMLVGKSMKNPSFYIQFREMFHTIEEMNYIIFHMYLRIKYLCALPTTGREIQNFAMGVWRYEFVRWTVSSKVTSTDSKSCILTWRRKLYLWTNYTKFWQLLWIYTKFIIWKKT